MLTDGVVQARVGQIVTKPVLRFNSQKALALFLKKRNPRKVCWTVAYRKTMKKGTQEEMARRRNRRVKKSASRGYTSMDVETLTAKRSEKPADRKAARSAALAEVKDRKAKAKGKGKKN